MSIRTLLLAVRDTLRNEIANNEEYGIDESEIDVRGSGGRPPPHFAWKFLAVHSIGWEPGDIKATLGIHEVYTVGVSLTVKAGQIPEAELAHWEYYTQGDGMEAILRSCIAAIHQNYSVVTLANEYMPNPSADLHQRHLEWIGTDPEPREEDPSWVASDDDGEIFGAYVQTVRFRGGDRVQRLSLLE